MATYSYKHAVKMGGKIIPANTEIKTPQSAEPTAPLAGESKGKKKAKAKAVEPETAAVDTANAE